MLNEENDIVNTLRLQHQKSCNEEIFTNLICKIFDVDNILLAYRNIKKNGRSKTPGIDGLSIDDISKMKPDEVIRKVKEIVFNKNGYHPKPVIKKIVPKTDGTLRPVGIPAIWDRLIQQCILQIMEPICESKFSNNSYGFRPQRSCENAIQKSYQLLSHCKCCYVVEINIQNFFDNVNHSKLIKQIWSLGIHDKRLIWLIKQILKTEVKMPNGEITSTNKGVFQSGVLSSLLANINLNEFDKWIESKFQLHPKAKELARLRETKKGTMYYDYGHGYRRLRKTLKKKEVWIVRYADEIRLFCKTKEEAKSIKEASERWFQSRLKLELSANRTRIIDARNHRTEFLGFEIKLRKNTKNKKWSIESHISERSIERIKAKLTKQLEKIVHSNGKTDEIKQLTIYNAIVMGVQNYYQVATCISKDLNRLQQTMYRNMYIKFKNKNSKGTRFVKNGRKLTSIEQKRYGTYKSNRYLKGCGVDEPIYQIGCVKFKAPSGYKECQVNNDESTHGSTKLIVPLMKSRLNSQNDSIEYYDNKISLYSAQDGKCAISGETFQTINEIHAHHKIPKKQGGKDDYQNLVLIKSDYHRLVHSSKPQTIIRYIIKLQVDAQQLRKINLLRYKIGLKGISKTYTQLKNMSKIDDVQILE